MDMGCPYEAGLEGERGRGGGQKKTTKQQQKEKSPFFCWVVFFFVFLTPPPPPGPQGLRPVGASLTRLSFLTITPYPKLACWRKPLHASFRSCT